MHIKTFGHIEKAAKLQQGEVEFTVSTDAWDSHGERINVDGIELKDYKKNPVVLWAHDGYNLPIAKTTKIWKEGNKLMARAQFYLKDEFPMKVYNYIVDGYLNAVSIGGMVEEWGSDGVTISKLIMKEFSVVPIPANQDALIAAKSFSDEQREELQKLEKSHAIATVRGTSDLLDRVDILEKTVATLKEVANSKTEQDSANGTIRVVLRQAQVVDKQVEEIIKVVKKEFTNE